MDTIWLQKDLKSDFSILVGDIGGTHTSLGLVGKQGRTFTLQVKFLFKTQSLSSIFTALEEVRRIIPTLRNSGPLTMCCLSVAGPVQDNFCRMTNVNWEIKGLDIEAFLGARTLIINDFLALSYALP
ncbi:MAG: glucokinase, partial [Spirochaetales bacterium]